MTHRKTFLAVLLLGLVASGCDPADAASSGDEAQSEPSTVDRDELNDIFGELAAEAQTKGDQIQLDVLEGTLDKVENHIFITTCDNGPQTANLVPETLWSVFNFTNIGFEYENILRDDRVLPGPFGDIVLPAGSAVESGDCAYAGTRFYTCDDKVLVSDGNMGGFSSNLIPGDYLVTARVQQAGMSLGGDRVARYTKIVNKCEGPECHLAGYLPPEESYQFGENCMSIELSVYQYQ